MSGLGCKQHAKRFHSDTSVSWTNDEDADDARRIAGRRRGPHDDDDDDDDDDTDADAGDDADEGRGGGGCSWG